MALELRIQDAPRQDLGAFGEYVYRIRIEHRPDITYEEARRKRSLVDPRSIPFIEFDLPAHIVCPGCAQHWQKALCVIELKKIPYQSSAFLITEALKFGVLQKEDIPGWAPEERDQILFQKPRLNLPEE